jgi:hypothetical protein
VQVVRYCNLQCVCCLSRKKTTLWIISRRCRDIHFVMIREKPSSQGPQLPVTPQML